jgi:hypothetical protein
MLLLQDMSWLNDNTGRPKEEGGHERINISVDLPTRMLLDRVSNRSKMIECCVKVFFQPKWKHYIELEETICTGSEKFEEGASFEFRPYLNPGNAVLGMNCYFDRFLDDDGMAFRVSVNGMEGKTLLAHPSGIDYSTSQVYSEKELGFFNMEKTFRDEKHYVFKFKFKPLGSSGWAKVKDIHFLVCVIENPLLNEITDISRLIDH